MTCLIRAVVLLSISDHRSRNSLHKYGALVGRDNGSDVIITHAFEVKSDAKGLDMAFLTKKLTLITTVSPAAKFMGLYSTLDNDLPDHIVGQLQQENEHIPSVFLAPQGKGFKCFDAQTGEDIAYTLAPGESEVIATSTVQSYPNYTQDEPEIEQENVEPLVKSLQQLQAKIQDVLSNASAPDAETDLLLMHLATLIANYRGDAAAPEYQLVTSHLCLLSNQLAAVKTADSQVQQYVQQVMALPLGIGGEFQPANTSDNFTT